MDVLLISILLAIVAGIIFTAIGLISGSDETAVLVPATLIVVLLGAPPEAVFAFFYVGGTFKASHACDTNCVNGCAWRYNSDANAGSCQLYAKNWSAAYCFAKNDFWRNYWCIYCTSCVIGICCFLESVWRIFFKKMQGLFLL